MSRSTRSPKIKDRLVGMPLRHGVYQGVVRKNTDEQRMGRLFVFVPEFGGDPTNSNDWVTVSYCSPFAGATDPEQLGNDPKQGSQSQNSYGFWMVPPDINSIVLIMFVNGDPSRGIWIGSLYQQFMNNMVPGIAASTTYEGDTEPTTEYNKSAAKTDAIKDETKQRPTLNEVRDALEKQGLLEDPIRGITTSSARRESPSEVYGISTPGPLRQDGVGRKGGSQFVMDDKDGEERIRLRTRSGAQLLLDESNGLVYIINRDGTAWMQMDAEGNIDAYTNKSYTVRAEQDVNIHADNNINMYAGKNINMRSERNININSANNLQMLAEQNFYTTSGRNFGINSGRNIDIRSVRFTKMDHSIFLRGTGSANPPKLEPLTTTDAKVIVNGESVTIKTISPRTPSHEPSPTHKLTGLNVSIIDKLSETFSSVVESIGVESLTDIIDTVTSELSSVGGILDKVTDLSKVSEAIQNEVITKVLDKLPKDATAVSGVIKNKLS